MIHTLETPERVILAGKIRVCEVEKQSGYWVTIGYVGNAECLMVSGEEELDEVIALLQEAKRHIRTEEMT